MRRLLTLTLLLPALFICGCSQGIRIYNDPENVSIYLYDKPVVTENSYDIRFRFAHNDDEATHVVQALNWHYQDGAGVESFRTYLGKFPLGQSDRHYNDAVQYERRVMTLMAGSVEGADETTLGFAMLPSEWPSGFNPNYIAKHKIIGRVTYLNEKSRTQYTLEFKDGTLTFEVQGTDVKYVWTGSTAD